MLKWDGHTHTQFCYHGNPAPLEQYIERAIELGFKKYSVTEHPPLPTKWVTDEALFNELGMPDRELSLYFAEVEKCKIKYKDKIEIVSGLELDFLFNQTNFTDQLLEKYSEQIDDIVYSVHYLPGKDGENFSVDFTAPYFNSFLLDYYGSMDRVVEVYFDHIELALEHAKQFNKRTRIGHLLLINKFEKLLPPTSKTQIDNRLEKLIPLLKKYGIGVDVNVAGKRVTSYEESYVPEWFIKKCIEENIECVYGSDAHKPEQVGLFWDWFEKVTSR